MKCVNHDQKDAIAMCVACGVGLCPDCRKVVRGATYCEDCAKTHEPMMVHPGEKPGLNAWAVVAWILAVVGWWPGLAFVSLAGLALGFVALGDMALRGGAQSGAAHTHTPPSPAPRWDLSRSWPYCSFRLRPVSSLAPG